MGTRSQAFIVVPLAIGTLIGLFVALGCLLVGALGIPARLHMPLLLRAAGAGPLALGAACMAWLFRYRSPLAVLVSTYLSIQRALRGEIPQKALPSTEPLILQGPQRHVRHPMYFAVVVIWLGWWLLLDYTLVLFMTFFFLLWFTLVVIRFEERELKALFAERYQAYAEAVPMIFPSLRPRWPLPSPSEALRKGSN
jgi:protein-S-isoprenylcysteine O-methyltransferase Ste14